MNEWKETKAYEYCLNVTDGTHDSPKPQNEGKPLVTSKHIKNNRLDLSDAYLITQEDYDKIVKRSNVSQWDVIISMIGAYCGFCYIQSSSFTDYAVKNVGLFKVGDEIKSKWLYYYLNSPDGKEQLFKARRGSSQPYLSLNSLRNLIIPTPSFLEQKQIVSILSALDDKIETNRKINARLEELAQALFKSWFIDNAIYDGSTVADYILPKRGKSLLTSDAKFGDIPVVAGGLSPATFHNQANTKAPVITVSASGANAGYVNIWGCPVWSSDSSFIDNSVTPYIYFWYNLLKYYQGIIYHSQTGCAQPHIYPKHIGNINIPKLTMSKIADFDKIIKPLYMKIFDNKKESARLAALRDTLLPKLMSGELIPE